MANWTPIIGTLLLSRKQWQHLLDELDLLLADIVPGAESHVQIAELRSRIQKAFDDAVRSADIRAQLRRRRA